MKCRISRALLDSLADRCRTSAELESCGLLLGVDGEIRTAVAVPNRSEDPDRSFVLDTTAQLSASRAARQAEMRVLGHYHWHPSGSALPSIEDCRAAEAQHVYWLILADTDRRMWISRHGGLFAGVFDPVALVVCKALPCQSETPGPIEAPADFDISAGAISA